MSEPIRSTPLSEPSEQDDKAAMAAALDAWHAGYRNLTDGQKVAYLSCMATVAISILRGMAGPSFTKGYLEETLLSMGMSKRRST